MSSQQKRGFRLPWAADRASEDGAAGAATLEPVDDPGSGADSDDLGEGPVRLSDASPQSTTDAAPAESDVPVDTAEATMFDVDTTQGTTAAEAQDDGRTGSDWPDVDRRNSPQHAGDADLAIVRPAIHAAGEPRARRDNPLVAGLVKAMREAAVASRDETLARLNADAEARVTGIRARATTEAAELKHRAENDIGEIREWSKAEIARIREETEARIEARKAELAAHTARHAESVERLVTGVQAVVDSFQADMDQFFDRLLAEEDPARLAALAEQAPDAPDLTGEGPAALDLLDAPDDVAPQADALAADAAAAAEVAASEGLHGDAIAWPAMATRRAGLAADGDEEDGATRLLVTGLTSVAGISAFKGALGQLPGVRSVSVSSGDPGVFVFAISHEPQVDLATGIASLPGFSARITEATNQGINVIAHEPVA